jgi:hypothetical protein
MAEFEETRGAFGGGLPHNRLGHGPRILVALKPFYTEMLLGETAGGIPNARMILYPGKGHDAPAGKQFGQDVLTTCEFGMRR